jgi:hypothetical protein
VSLRALRDHLGRIGSRFVSLVLLRPGDRLASRLSCLGLRPGYVPQSGMLILTDVGEDRVNTLYQTLEHIRERLRQDKGISFHNTTTVHYAAWMILPAARDNKNNLLVPARLALETNYDGCLEEHLQDLVNNCQEELDEVYNYLPDYPPRKSETRLVRDFLCARYRETSRYVDRSAYYNALPGRSLADIKNAIAVYDEAKCFVDTLDKDSDSKAVRSALVEHFKDPWVVEPKRFPITQKGIRALFVINMAVLLLLFPIALLYLLGWGMIDVIARYFEWREGRKKLFDSTQRKPPDYSHLDLGNQNHLCTYTTIKPGCFRMWVIKRALWLGSVLSNYFFIQGKLDQIATIHFARWTLIGQQLIFYGSYDGSWSSYLTDFSDEAWGVNMVWSNTIGFPPTKYIVGRGARDLEAFQRQAMEHYAPAPVFYSAYRTHSLVNLLRYLKFRDELLEEIGA